MLAALLMPAAMLAAPAQIDATDSAYDACVEAESSNTAWAMCGGALLERKEAALGAAWKAFYGALDAKTKKVALAEQRLWIKYKDASCSAWQSGYYGREGQVLHFYVCRAGVIAARIEELRGYDLEG